MTEAVAVGARSRPIALSWIAALKVLLVADTAVQMRNKRSLALSLFLPLILLFALSAGKRANALGDPRVLLAESITVGIVTLGVIGYSTAVARDREQGVFQRLRVTPAPTWTIMASRLAVQIVATLGIAVVVLVVGYAFKHVALDAVGYVLTLVIVVLGAALFLSIGQAIVGLIPSADTLNSMGRFVLIPLMGLTLLGHTELLGTTVEYISRWSPGGAFSSVLAAAMNPSVWNGETWGALAASLAYAAVFAGMGVRWFRWTAR